jgi:hypothetical protein
LLSDEANQLSGIDKRVQSVSEQLNWTNTALRGMATQIYITNDYAKKEQIMDLQVSTNTIVHSVDQIQEKVIDCKEKMDSALLEISYRARESNRNHEEIMEGLGTAFSAMGKSLTEIKGRTSQPDKPIPTSFLLPSSHISILSPVYKPSETESVKKFPLHFPLKKDKPESSKKSQKTFILW